MPLRSRPEPVTVAALLTAAGGFLDAYTYVVRGGVMANAQTGNLVLMAASAGGRDWTGAARHLPSLFAFLLGTAVVEAASTPRWRRLTGRPVAVVLLAEIVLLALVGLWPAAGPDTATTLGASAVVAFAAALQMNTFRSVRGAAYSSTIATGNLRSLVEVAHRWLSRGERAARRRALDLVTITSTFVAGAVLGALASRWWHERAVWGAVALLLVVLGRLALDSRRAPAQDPA